MNIPTEGIHLSFFLSGCYGEAVHLPKEKSLEALCKCFEALFLVIMPMVAVLFLLSVLFCQLLRHLWQWLRLRGALVQSCRYGVCASHQVSHPQQ